LPLFCGIVLLSSSLYYEALWSRTLQPAGEPAPSGS
jgi:hypothetical protein